MTKFYEVSGHNNLGDLVAMIVTADNSVQAKRKFIKGDLIPYFEGYDNSDWNMDELSTEHLVKLDHYKPNDNFNILRALILQYDRVFNTLNDLELSKQNYSDEQLRLYLATGEID